MPKEPTIVHFFWKHVLTRPERVALMRKRDGHYQDILWKEYGHTVRQLVNVLEDEGIRQGDVVGILSNNRPEWAMADLAILTLGAISVSVYATNVPKEVGYILQHSEAKLVFAEDASQVEKILSVRHELPSLRKIVVIEAASLTMEGDFIVSWNDFRQRGEELIAQEKLPPEQRVSKLHGDDLAIVIYTSGTTGPPKGVILTHDNILFTCQNAAGLNMMSENEIFFSFLPLAHALERVGSLYFPIYMGARVGYAERVETVPDNLREVAPTVVMAVPRFFEKIYQRITSTVMSSSAPKKAIFLWAMKVGKRSLPYRVAKQPLPLSLRPQYYLAERLAYRKLRDRLGGRLRFFVSGGAPLPRDIAEFFYAVGLPIFEAYGATETTAPATANNFDDFKFGTVGKPLPGVDIKLAEDGEILIRGRNVFRGYYKDPRATEEALVEGWYHSGDIGRLDDEGFLTILDRKKELIITSAGKNISPQNIEGLLKHDPLISQAVAIGDRRNYLTALLTLNIDMLHELARQLGIGQGTSQEIVEHPRVIDRVAAIVNRVNTQLARFEQIKKFRILPEDFSQATGELTPTMKLRRKFIAEKYAREIANLYGEAATTPAAR
jgi:long-chain acyl-CoA synthetase